jgi:hypothetical protein
MSTSYPQVGGYPQYPQYTAPAYKLHDVASVALAAFLGGPLAGTILMASNYRKLGQGSKGALAILVGAIASAGEIYIGLTSTKNPAIATLLLFAATWFAAYELQGNAIKTHVAWGGKLASKWAALGTAIVTVLILGGALIAYIVHTGQLQKFEMQYGIARNVVTIGTKDQVIYSGTATQTDATALGNELKTAGYFQDRGVTVVLNKGTNGTTISFVVEDGIWNQAGMLSSFEEVARNAAPSVGGLPVQMQLMNSNQVVEKTSTVGEIDMGGGDAVIYEGTETQATAQALGQQLKTMGFFLGKGANVFLTKHDDGTTLAFVVADGTWNDPEMVGDFETIARTVAPTIGGLPIDMHMDNTTLTVEKDEVLK